MSESDIQAYTDGSIAHERVAHVRRYLAIRPGEWRRIAFYRRLNAQIRQTFPASDEPLAGLRVANASSAARGGLRAVRALAAASALALVLAGAAAAWVAASGPSAQVLDDAAVMALMEATGGAGAAAAPPAAAGGAAAARFDGLPFDLSAAGLRAVSAGTMTLGPLAYARRFVYENADGEPVVLLEARALLAHEQPQWAARRAGPLRLIGWTAHGVRWVLAGRAQTHGLMRAADLATMAPADGARACVRDDAAPAANDEQGCPQ